MTTFPVVCASERARLGPIPGVKAAPGQKCKQGARFVPSDGWRAPSALDVLSPMGGAACDLFDERGDYGTDGLLDVAISGLGEQSYVSHGLGTPGSLPQFPSTPGAPWYQIGWSVTCSDLDNDGYADLFFTSGLEHTDEAYPQVPLILWGGTDGLTLDDGALLAEAVNERGSIDADLDGDGCVDKVQLPIVNSPVDVIRNRTCDRTVLRPRLVTRSGHPAYGAAVTAHRANGTIIAVYAQQPTGGYSGWDASPRLTISAPEPIDHLIVHWNDGVDESIAIDDVGDEIRQTDP